MGRTSVLNMEFFTFEGELREVNTEDGKGVYPVIHIGVHTGDGRTYIYCEGFLPSLESCENDVYLELGESKAQEMIEKIIEKMKTHGSINFDSDNWVSNDAQDEGYNEASCRRDWEREQFELFHGGGW